jgi:hypothetical protein
MVEHVTHLENLTGNGVNPGIHGETQRGDPVGFRVSAIPGRLCITQVHGEGHGFPTTLT